jgi:hypothetical protein
LSLIINIHFSLLFENKDLNIVDVQHCERLRKAHSIFHGIPRLCFRSLTPPGLQLHAETIDEAVDDIESFATFVQATKGGLPFDSKASHRLIRVEPTTGSNWRKAHRELMSNYVAERVSEHVLMITQAQLSEKLAKYLANPDTHVVAGVLFEHAAHFSIRKGLKLTMTALPSGPGLLEIDITGTRQAAANLKNRYYSLDIREKSGSHDVHPDFLDLYMTPISKNEPSIDALFISSTQKATFLFQMTVSRSHPVKFRGLDKVFNNLPANARKKIYIVFVIPAKGSLGEEFQGIQSHQSIDAPQNADAGRVSLFEGFPQYVCKLDIDAIRWS